MVASDALFVAAQSLFVMLPLCSLYSKRAGHPSRLQPPQVLAMLCGILAFALLIIKFALDASSLCLWPCAVNLLVRVVEAVRALALHCRVDDSSAHAYASAVDHGTGLLN